MERTPLRKDLTSTLQTLFLIEKDTDFSDDEQELIDDDN